ncbi:Tex family protein [Pseudophaeobacter leonis]|uniref:Tex family protein n=1 Tax=Pseudophaeobacter leonis TaxID=1144477 RepID=UPI0009F58593|nr:Tex family protein [Pseudophaeobacter leonis]
MDTAARIAQKISSEIAKEIGAAPKQVNSAVTLLDEGATVPFVARYRKEATGGLDDTQLRTLAERLSYLRELEARRASIFDAIKSQDKLTEDLAVAIAKAETKAQLEDIYLPYKTKRRTKAMIARENGLEPLVEAILADHLADPEVLAAGYLSEAVPGTKEALNGARDILTERMTENAGLLGRLRQFLQADAPLTARLIEGKEQEGAKFSDYFDHTERWADVPSHRALAMLRGANEGVLSLDIGPEPDEGVARAEGMVAAELGAGGTGPGDKWLRKVAGWTWRVKLSLSMMLELMSDLRARAQDDAIHVFARNLKDLLFAAPAGARPTLGLDPGIRTGVKAAVVDATGKVLATETLYPFQPKNDLRGAQVSILKLIAEHGVELVAIGNGTASRETERMVAEVIKHLPAKVKAPTKVVVSEAGASVYSASELAAREFPDLDVSLRGAVSIARRLQDPLAELVKIEPKSIGVGQYQHDVDQHRLSKSLEAVIEDVVNAVGVDLNMASAPLLSHVSGLGPGLAEAIVAHRDINGAFASRRELLKVARLGPKAFEQCAGFLRIRDGKEPLDASSVHPEAYSVARRVIAACGRDIRQIMGDSSALKSLHAEQFVDETFGLPTVRDIFSELEKPGRDPRPSFVTATFAEGVETMKDLKPGMVLEGTVTNVAAFGAFVDIGVHQDGLVHVSQLADNFVKDPHEVVKTGQVVKVTVTEVDVARKRIALTMRKDGGASARDERNARGSAGRDARGGAAGGAPRGGQKAGRKPGGKPGDRSGSAGGRAAMSSSPKSSGKSETSALGAALMDAFKKT